MEKFWLVWNEQGSSPTLKHSTEKDAKGEAERLARSNPGQTFHVLTLVDSCRKHDVIWLSEAEKEDVPF